MTDILALGELLVDVAPDKTENPGGAPCNFLAAAAHYGASTQFIGAVGDDSQGALLREALAAAGVGTAGLKTDAAHGTTMAFVTLDEKGDRGFSFRRGADQYLSDKDIPYALIDDCRIFYFAGSLSLTEDPCRRALKNAVRYAKEKGKLIAFDPNLRIPLWEGDLRRAKEELLWGLSVADMVKISEEEVAFLGEPSAPLIMITLGEKGAVLRCSGKEVSVSCPPVRVLDTTGAGDIFFGAAVAKILDMKKDLSQLTLEEIKAVGEYAVNKASLSTEKMGGIPSIAD